MGYSTAIGWRQPRRSIHSTVLRQAAMQRREIDVVHLVVLVVAQDDVDQASSGHGDSYPQGSKSATISVTKRWLHCSGNPPLADPAISGGLCCEIPRPKRQRQQLAQCHCAAPNIRIADVNRRHFIGEFMQPLTASAVRRNQCRSLANDQHPEDTALAGHHHCGNPAEFAASYNRMGGKGRRSVVRNQRLKCEGHAAEFAQYLRRWLHSARNWELNIAHGAGLQKF